MPRVTLENTGRVFDVPENANLRQAMLREGVTLYYGLARVLNCGGRARCRTCAVRVVAGADALSPRTPAERARMEGAAPEMRLACQANVRGDVVVNARVKR